MEWNSTTHCIQVWMAIGYATLIGIYIKHFYGEFRKGYIYAASNVNAVAVAEYVL